MVFWIELGLFLTGVLLLAIGYHKNRRGLLLAGAIALYGSATLIDFSTGVIAGFRRGYVD